VLVGLQAVVGRRAQDQARQQVKQQVRVPILLLTSACYSVMVTSCPLYMSINYAGQSCIGVESLWSMYEHCTVAAESCTVGRQRQCSSCRLSIMR